MKIFSVFLLLVLCRGIAFCDGPIFQHKDTFDQQEFENAYQNIRSLNVLTASGTIRCIDLPTFCVDTTNHRIGVGIISPIFAFDLQSSNANATLRINNTSSFGPAIRFDNSGTLKGWVGTEGGWLGNSSQDMMIGANTGGQVHIYTNGGVTSAFEFSASSTTSTNVFYVSAGIHGVSDASSASAGNYGEYVSSATTVATPVGASGVNFDMGQIVLTAGDWDIAASVLISRNGATCTSCEAEVGIGTTAGNSLAGTITGSNFFVDDIISAFSSHPMFVPRWRVSITSNTTYYFKGEISSYSVAVPLYRCLISARRVR